MVPEVYIWNRMMSRLPSSAEWLRERFTLTVRRRVTKDHIVSVDGVQYEVPRGRSGEWVDLLRRLLERTGSRLALAERTLAALSPLATLDRGYAIVTRLDDGRILTDTGTVTAGQGIGVRLARGELEATVVKRRDNRTSED